MSTAEQQELQAWANKSDGNRRFFQQATDEQSLLADLQQFTAAAPDDKAFHRTLAELSSEAKVVGMRPWRKYIAVAASVSIVVVLAGAYFFNRSRIAIPAVATTATVPRAAIHPGHDGAILTLADGKTVVLDSAAAGTLATQGNTRVVLAQGKLTYATAKKNPANPSTDIVYYNQLATPRGRKFSITLPDGSKVWLNAVSSLRYPVQFAGNERRVQITGEAYFEIAPNPHKPFIVQTALPNNTGAEVQVLGTHFNVMAYNTEDAMKTTLLEGRVAIRTTNNDQRPTVNDQRPTLLRPGQQSTVTLSLSKGASKEITVTDNIDLDQAIAWKNGLLSFDHADLKSVMRAVERWYDIDVKYDGKIPGRSFSGKFPNDASIQQLLTILDVNDIHYSLDGRTLTVKP